MLICTDDYPPPERFDRYQEAAEGLTVPILIDRASAPSGDFWAVWRSAELGGVSVASIACRAPYRFRRTPELIRRSDPEAYRLVLNLRGHSGVAHDRHHAELAPGDLALYETSSPFDGWRGSGTVTSEWIMATFPRTLLPISPRIVAPFIGRRLPGQDGIGALVTGMMQRLAKDLHSYRPADRLRLSYNFLDLLTTLLHHETESSGIDGAGAQHRTLMIQICSFVRHHLGDQTLSPEMIAAAHNISLRTLHRLFARQGKTVTAWIRAQRLEHCRRDLADPELRDRPIHAIAGQWGFPSHAHFTRAFRAAYGVSPLDHRRQVLAPQGTPPLGAHWQGSGTHR
jgi:AraC-like DNA-binding protein